MNLFEPGSNLGIRSLFVRDHHLVGATGFGHPRFAVGAWRDFAVGECINEGLEASIDGRGGAGAGSWSTV